MWDSPHSSQTTHKYVSNKLKRVTKGMQINMWPRSRSTMARYDGNVRGTHPKDAEPDGDHGISSVHCTTRVS